MKKFLIAAVFILFLTFQTFINTSTAAELSDKTRTLTLDDDGKEVVVSIKEYTKGKKLFNNVCAQCHAGGITKTNPDISLDLDALSLAYPTRNHILGLIDYMKNPTSYDGFEEISELHPSLKSADIYPEMRNLTEDDLYSLAGFMLIEPKVKGKQWGGGKIFR